MLPCVNVKHVVSRLSVIADKMNLDPSVDLSSSPSIKCVNFHDGADGLVRPNVLFAKVNYPVRQSGI